MQHQEFNGIFQPAATSLGILSTASLHAANGFRGPSRHFMNNRKRRGKRAAEPIERHTRTSLTTKRRRRSQVTCYLDVHVSVQQQVLRLEVPVDDVAVVAVLHRRQDLPELSPGLHLAQPPVLRQVVCGKTVEEKTTTGRSFHVAS